LAWSGKEHAGWLSGSVIILAALVLAYFTTRFIERPWRNWRWPEARRRRAVLAVMLVVSVAAGPLTFWRHHIHHSNSMREAVLGGPDYPGALSLRDGYGHTPRPGVSPAPGLEVIDQEWPEFDEPCENDGENVNVCSNFIPGGSRHIVILGNSHGHVLNTPVQLMAEKYRWTVTSITKGFCPLTDELGPGITEECLEFNQQGMDTVLDLKPDLVLTTSTRTSSEPGVTDVLDNSWIREARKLNDAGIPVVGVRATPRMPAYTPTCLEENPDNLEVCGSPFTENFTEISPTDALAGELSDTRFLDFTPYFCPDGFCPAIIGNVIVYKDGNHVTRSYMTTLAPIFEREFLSATGWKV
jgi:hypothetical protein